MCGLLLVWRQRQCPAEDRIAACVAEEANEEVRTSPPRDDVARRPPGPMADLMQYAIQGYYNHVAPSTTYLVRNDSLSLNFIGAQTSHLRYTYMAVQDRPSNA